MKFCIAHFFKRFSPLFRIRSSVIFSLPNKFFPAVLPKLHPNRRKKGQYMIVCLSSLIIITSLLDTKLAINSRVCPLTLDLALYHN